jgi:hypothetical protein
MKPIILITACAYHLVRVAQCRATWLAAWGHLIDYRFVFGNGYYTERSDELVFPVDDSYMGLPAKIQQSHKWAVDHEYTHILKTDCDIYLHIPRLLDSGFDSLSSYIGNFYYSEFAMGAAYWLDKKASEILVNAPLPFPGTPGGDDIWVGRVMAEHGITGRHDARYHIGYDIDWDACISLHTTGPPRLDMAEIHNRMMQ